MRVEKCENHATVVTNALDITSGEELLRFDMGEITIAHTTYTVLTGYEGTDKCWWCGSEPHRGKRGRPSHFCWGHGRLYDKHFNWNAASSWALERAGHKCENCGANEMHVGFYKQTNLEVHHIVPLNGAPRFYSAFNLPWNLIALCHKCHLLIAAVMRGAAAIRRMELKRMEGDAFRLAGIRGQAVMPFALDLQVVGEAIKTFEEGVQ